MSRRLLFALVLLLTLVPAAYAQAANPNKKAAVKPNVDIYVYRRCYTPTEPVQISVSGFNVHAVQFAAYPLDLSAAVKTSRTLENFGKTVKALDLTGRKPSAVWHLAMGKVFPDQWAQRGVKAPKLSPGVYVIQARAGGVEKRTWVAVTRIALVTKRGRQELLVYAADAISGRPVPGLPLTLADARGAYGAGRTDADGVLRVSSAGAHGNLWISGNSHGDPAFALSGEPSAPDPYVIYTVTDRPIYRPGSLVQYKATIRQHVEAEAPGGFAYRTYADRPAIVEIRDATDALVASRTVTTNAQGALSGTFTLASEPTLGDWHLNVSIGDYHAYGGFTVQDYRKPEMIVTLNVDKTHYLGGTTVPFTVDAQYYFGRPVTDATVQYNVTYSGGSAETNYDGKGVTDAQGQLHLQIPTQRLPDDRTLAVHAVVTDLSRRSQSADADTTLTAGLFQLNLSTDTDTYKPGQRIEAAVQATDYDGKPVATKVQISMIETKEDRQHRAYQETTTRDIVTDAAGKGIALFSSPRPGDLHFTATAFDTGSDKITADTDATVATVVDATIQNQPTLSLAAGQPSYKPGEVATVRLSTTLVRRPFVPATKTTPAQPAHPDAWALVTVEGERLGRSQVVHLTQKNAVLRIPLTAADFPSVSVNVAIIEDRQIYEQQQRLSVARRDQVLTVSVASDKATYRPGDTAAYTVTTRDFRGRPVPADVSLGVVDSSIYALQPDNAPDMAAFFYGDQTVRVQTDFSFAAQYSGGGYQNVASSAEATPPGANSIRVRSHFADTAYWNPDVETGADGRATVSYTVPDNVTTWRATAHGVTNGTAVGSATHDAIATMPLLVRLELPRFSVQGDQVVVSAVVQNGTETARTVQAHITATGATLTGAADRTLQLPASGQARLDWTAILTGPASASFLVTADGGAGGQDATAQTLPVLPAGLRVVTAGADTLSDADAQDKVDIADLPPGATLTLTLSPSLASAVFDALGALESAPGGDAEETVSAFLPDIAVARALRRLPNSRPVHPHLDQWVSLGLQKLYRYQHPDGGWNWWEFDQTDGDMTAYVLGGLVQARDAGYTVDDQRILRGTAALEKLLPDQQDLGRRADWLLPLAYAAPADAEKPLTQLYGQRAKLDTYGRASLALALAQIGGPKSAAMAKTVAAELASNAVTQGRAVSWAAPPGGCLWRDDDVAVTAHALRALLAATPDSPLIPGAVRWLMANRDGVSWDSTRAGAEAVFALATYLEHTQELSPDYTAHVLLDGQAVGALTATPQNVFQASTTVTLTPAQLQGHTAATIDKQGAGVLYVSRVVSSLLPPSQVTPQAHGLTVRRQFRITVDDPSLAQSVASGSAMDVQLDITADADYRYVTLEDPIPAGCEVDTDPTSGDNFAPDYSDGDVGYTRQEVRDDEVVFFFDSLPKGRTHLTYHLNAETPGTYSILPSIAALTYFPEVRGNSGLVKTTIGEQP